MPPIGSGSLGRWSGLEKLRVSCSRNLLSSMATGLFRVDDLARRTRVRLQLGRKPPCQLGKAGPRDRILRTEDAAVAASGLGRRRLVQ